MLGQTFLASSLLEGGAAVSGRAGGLGRGPETLFGFHVVGILGQGAHSVIYAVCAPRTNQILALKHVAISEPKQMRYIDQLRSENAVGRLARHPGLRRPLDLMIKRNWFGKIVQGALLLEMVDGAPLDISPPGTIREIVGCLIDVAGAVDALNRAGYVHCDLKPNNVVRAHDGAIKVIDLGQSCPIGTVKTRMQGTPDFISPEQVRCRAVTPATDVYNAGAMMYALLTNRRVPTLYAARESGKRLRDEEIAPPASICAGVPEALSQLTMDCVRQRPEDRIADLGQVLHRLEAIAATLGQAPRRGDGIGANPGAAMRPVS